MEEKYNAGLATQSFGFIEFKKIVSLYHDGNFIKVQKMQCLRHLG